MERSFRIKLFKLALVTSPLIGAVNVAPIKIIVEAGEFDDVIQPDFLKGAILISSFVFALWIANILLFHLIDIKNKRIPRWGIYCLSYLMVYSITSVMFLLRFQPGPLEAAGLKFLPLITIFITNTFILTVMTLMIQREDFLKLKLEKADLELLTLTSMHNQLKAQIHPHFLFNCLSNLRSLIQMKDDRALHYSDLLSSFLRKSIDYSEDHFVKLQDELDFVNNYIELQQIRFTGAINYKVDLPKDYVRSKTIPVFTLQALVENAIKHNSFNTSTPLEIAVFLDEDHLVIKNNRIEKFAQTSSTGFGLNNLKDRFALAELDPPKIFEDSNHYIVKIVLK